MARELPPVQQVSRTQGAVAKLSKEPSKQTGTQFDESKYVKLGDETYVDKDTFEKLPQDTKEAGKRSGLDALKKSLSTHQANYDEIIKELKPFTSDSGINLAKALASGVKVERLKSEGIFSDEDINKALNYNKALEKVKQTLHHGEMSGTTVTGYSPTGEQYSYTMPVEINVLDANGNVTPDSIIKYYYETKDRETVIALGYNIGEVARAAKQTYEDEEEPPVEISKPTPPTTTPKPEEPIQVVYDPITGAPIIPPKMPEVPKVEEEPIKPSGGTIISTPVGPIVLVPPTLERPIIKSVSVEKPITEPDVTIAGGWKPDFTKANPYEDVPKEYLDYVAKTYVPTLEKPLPPTVGQLVDPETNTYINADNGLIQITDQSQVDGLNSSIEAKSERIYQEILDRDYERLGDGTYYPKSEFNRLSEEFKQVAKSQGIDSVRQLMDERSQKFESYKTENEFNTNKLIEGLDSGNITEQDIVAYFGQNTYNDIIAVRDSHLALRDKIKSDATAKGIDIVNISDLSIEEIQSLIESGSDPKDLILAGYDFDKVNVAFDKIYVDAQNRLSSSVVSVQINPVTGQKREIKGEINFDSLAKYRRENPDSADIERLYGKELVDTIDDYNTKSENFVAYLNDAFTPKEGGITGGKELDSLGRALDQLNIKPVEGTSRLAWERLDYDTKIKVAELMLQDPARGSYLGGLGADIDALSAKNLGMSLMAAPIQPITHVIGKQVTIDEARKILSENYKTEVNVAKDFVKENGTIDVNAFKSKLETDEEFKKQVLDQTGDDSSDDLIERLEYYNNGIRVTGEEWAIAGATGALDILSLGGAGALAGLGRFGKGAVVGINVASAGIFAPSAFRVIKDPKATITEKIISGATPILLLVGGSVGLKGKPAKAIKPENLSKATLGVKEVPVNARLEKATKDVSVAGITTRTIVNVKAIVPDTVRAIDNVSYKVDLNLEKAFQGLDDVVTTIKDYKGNIAKIKEVATGLGSDVRVKFDNAIYKIELNGERMSQSFDDLMALVTDYKNLQTQFNNAISGRVKVGVATLEDIRYRMELAGEKLAQKLDDITEGLTDYKGNWNALKSSLSEVGSEVRGKAEDILYKGELNIEQFSQKVDDIVSQVTDYKRNWTELKDNVKSVVKSANDATMEALYKIDVNLEQTAQKVEDGISNLTNIKPYIAEIKDLVKNADIKVRNNVNEFTYQLDLNSEKIAQRLQDYTEALLDYNRNWNEFTTKVKNVASMTKSDWDNLIYKLDVSGERVAQSFDDLVALVTDYKGNLEKLKSTLSEVKGGVEDSLFKAGLKIEEYAQKLDDLIEQAKTKRDLVHLEYLKKSAKNLKEDFNVELRIAELERTIKGKLADIKSRLDDGTIDEIQAENEIKNLRKTPEWIEHTKILKDLEKTFRERITEELDYKVSRLDEGLKNIARRILGDDIARQQIPFDIIGSIRRGDTVNFEQYTEGLKNEANKLPEEQRVKVSEEINEFRKTYNDLVREFKEGKLTDLKAKDIGELGTDLEATSIISGVTEPYKLGELPISIKDQPSVKATDIPKTGIDKVYDDILDYFKKVELGKKLTPEQRAHEKFLMDELRKKMAEQKAKALEAEKRLRIDPTINDIEQYLKKVELGKQLTPEQRAHEQFLMDELRKKLAERQELEKRVMNELANKPLMDDILAYLKKVNEGKTLTPEQRAHDAFLMEELRKRLSERTAREQKTIRDISVRETMDDINNYLKKIEEGQSLTPEQRAHDIFLKDELRKKFEERINRENTLKAELVSKGTVDDILDYLRKTSEGQSLTPEQRAHDAFLMDELRKQFAERAEYERTVKEQLSGKELVDDIMEYLRKVKEGKTLTPEQRAHDAFLMEELRKKMSSDERLKDLDNILKKEKPPEEGIDGGEGTGLPEEKPKTPKEGEGGVATKVKEEVKTETKVETKPETKVTKKVMTAQELEELMKKKTEQPYKFFEVPRTETDIEPFIIPDYKGEPYYTVVWEGGRVYTKLITPELMRRGYVELETENGNVVVSREDLISMTPEQARRLLSGTELGEVIKTSLVPIYFPSTYPRVFAKPEEKYEPIEKTEPELGPQPELETRPFEFTVPEPVTITPPEPITVTPPEPIEKIVTEPKEEVKPKELPYTMLKEEYDLKKRVIPPVVKIELSEEEKQAIVNNPPSGALVIIQGRPTYRGGTNAPMFKVIVPPYDEAHMFSTRLLPKGYVDYGFKGKGSAFKSVQVLGNPPNDIENLDLGIVKINVRMVDGKPIVSYAQDEDSNSGQRSKTVGYGAGQIPVEEWQEAKAQGVKYSDFIESHGEQQPTETEQKTEVKTEPIIEETVQPNNIVVEPKVEQELVEETEQELVEESETEIEDEYEPIIEEVEEDVIEEKPKQRESSGGWHSIDDLIGSEKDLQDLPPVNEQGVIVDESERFDSQVKEQDKKTIEDARNYLLNGLQKKLRYQFGHKKVYEVDPDYISKVMTKTYPELDEFQNSGNWKVYPNAIPLNEYWISNRLPKNNFKTSAIHEVVVADAMGQGRDKDKEYEDATVNVASVIDVYAMDNPNKLDRILAGALQGKYKSLLIEAKRGQEDLGSSEDISNEYREYGNISERGKRTKNWWDDKYYEQSDDTGLSYQNKYYRGRRLLPPSIGGNL